MTNEVNIAKTQRCSNLELYRIICMLLIVAHHYVVNSGLQSLLVDCSSVNNLFLLLFGAWGKTGINCFLMITGYFMCTSRITLRKFLKLVVQIYFYKLLLFAIFLFAGYESLSPIRFLRLILPFWGFQTDFVSCFIAFFLTIPFWTILVQNMSKRQHELLLMVTLGCYTILGSIPTFKVSFNYITWFGIIFLIASYIRLYPLRIFEKRALWGWLSFLFFILAMTSVVLLQMILGAGYFLISDCNKFFAVLIAVTSFLWFKNLNIKYSKIINAFGAGTFGVLLIHANSDAMRTWLWKDTLDIVGHYSMPIGELVLYCFGAVISVFIICNLIDQLRIATFEKWFFNWYDNKVAKRADNFVNKILFNE